MSNLSVYARTIADSVEMRAAFELYGIQVNGHGYAACPFHNEKTPSLKVYSDHYHCFGCGESGDVITFVRKLFSLDFADALDKLNTDFSLNLPIGERMTIRQSREYNRRTAEIKRSQERDRQRRQHMRDEYNALIDERVRLDTAFRLYRPLPGDDRLHPAFAEACKQLDYIDFLIDNYTFEEVAGA